MRFPSLAVAACVLGACATPNAKQVIAQTAPTPASTCDTGASPLLVVDGVVRYGVSRLLDNALQRELGDSIVSVLEDTFASADH